MDMASTEKTIDVSRYTKRGTAELRFDIEFITPTFLGGADENAEIRTAPFKNLLRRWWRIANGNLSPEELWKKESRLFGSTEKDPDTGKIFGKSKVVLKILETQVELQKTNRLRFADMKITHPEVRNPMGFETYLGMGPIFGTDYKKLPILEFSPAKKYFDKNTKKEALSPERKSQMSFSLFVPAGEKEDFIQVLSYINCFASIGSRSRNGWGSLLVKNFSCNEEPLELMKIKDIKERAEDWQKLISRECIKKYPSSIAKDEKGLLCWCAPQRDSWEKAMLDAAQIYSQVRTKFELLKNDLKLFDRHLLGYPVTHHEYSGWPMKNTRLPSELCMKINLNQGKYRVQITHIPNLIPLDGFSVEKQKAIWNKVHEFLDQYLIKNDKGEKKNLSRFGGADK